MTDDPMKNKWMPMTSVETGEVHDIRSDVHGLTLQIVNVCFVGKPADPKGWVLVDAGMPKSADAIKKVAKERYGKNSRPQAIILTHGHFDHVGAVVQLAEEWDVSVYAHSSEIPYLTGKKKYPDPDPGVEGGMVAKMSSLFPDEPVDLGPYIHELPEDGSVPAMTGWKWVHTPGHTEGHISLFRESDRTLLAGDAFVTVKQDELYKVFKQEKEITGPPRYFTPDWQKAKESVKNLAQLNPDAVLTGHGRPMTGTELKEGLHTLARHFEEIAVPDHGRYVDSKDENRV
ncbi:MBL fold metallo-hydrolase [Alteribacillus iranensis]|uniref:Glyoxylase, beta-lactamase superfamily II n=1 Tax=Alteribacillus iranensis TaxID=930128 RepID=A0A1I2AHH0_9BACI|nr:MBL fold metallo-hydrolase [Alteribacillus iranensis]SFE43157.1 Glyoxylase, beta-lactamase superfamily II [Alteribacillus iranensis]